jgi:hypothetical protein
VGAKVKGRWDGLGLLEFIKLNLSKITLIYRIGGGFLPGAFLEIRQSFLYVYPVCDP